MFMPLLLAYVPALLSMMTVGIVVPFIGQLATALRASPAQMGLTIALFSMPTAILALASGGLVDRFGVRRTLLVSLVLSAAGSLCAGQSGTLLAMNASMSLAGIGYGGICVAAPCLLMQTLEGPKRTRAMSFFPTYPPTGYAAGLLLAALFVDAGNWSTAFQIHGGLLLIAWVFVWWLLPRQSPPVSAQSAAAPTRGALRSMLDALREPRVMLLGIAVALPNAVSYGTSLAAPAHLARLYDVSLAASATAVAAAKIVALIIGGITMGYLLSRNMRTTRLFAGMASLGLLAQAMIFLPIAGIVGATLALIIWIFAFGGMVGGAMALLPRVVRDPSRSGSASGMVNQFISAASFAAPSTWLAITSGAGFVALAAVCLAISLLALPRQS
jgi:predicted MFS family arabinose efflux permease